MILFTVFTVGGSASVHAGIPTHLPPGPGRHHPPPRAEHTGRYGQRAGGMHPTGMQSCFEHFPPRKLNEMGKNFTVGPLDPQMKAKHISKEF